MFPIIVILFRIYGMYRPADFIYVMQPIHPVLCSFHFITPCDKEISLFKIQLK